MIGCIWNCRGIKKKGMTSYLSGIIQKNILDFVGLKETMKSKYTPAFFRKLDPSNVFSWDWIPSIGKSGGVLCGFRNDTFKIQSVRKGQYIIQFRLHRVSLACDIAILVVHGSAHEEHKMEFLSELSSFCNDLRVPYVVGGDFNVLRHSEDKNSNSPLAHSSDLFNAIINTLRLREIYMAGGIYTWTNNQVVPILDKLDRILMSPTWEDLFPLVCVRKLLRELSDHNPLIMDCGLSRALPSRKRTFHFDLNWLKNEQFFPVVQSIWDKHVNDCDPIDILNIKLKIFKKYFKDWGANLFGHNKKRQELQVELQILESLEELTILDPMTYKKKVDKLVELHDLYAEEEMHWFKMTSERWLIQGDNNTYYFHKIANGRRRKKLIHSLDSNDGIVEGTDNLIKHATDYYKELFGPAPGNLFPMSLELWDESEKMSLSNNETLTRPFSIEKIKNALFAMDTNKAP